MSISVTANAKRLWDEWNLRCAVLISLFFQVILVLLANSRKTKGSTLLTAIIWCSYLLADWIAAFAVGLISSGLTDDCREKSAVNNQLATFWAPFLLLHLGGPDAITAFALEDNELWIRHFLGLLIQLLAVVYVFFQSLPNEYWIPTVLMFFAGTFKYAERTFALYQACLGNFKRSLLPPPDPGPNYAQFMEEYSVLEASNIPVEIKIEKEPEKYSDASIEEEPGNHSDASIKNQITSSSSMPTECLDIVGNGHKFFNTFKGIIVDHMFSFHERNESRKFFLSRSAVEAFKVMEVELNFMYDALYTKYAVVHCKIGYLCRFLCTALMVVCFQQFASLPKHSIILDTIVTYILLGGAICLDLVSVFNLVFSDWAIISAKRTVSEVLISLPFGKRQRRWSNTVSQHSFISFCLKKRVRWLNRIAEFVGIKDTLDEFRWKKTITCEEKLKEFIFKELKTKADKAPTQVLAKEIYSARGNWVLSNYYPSDCDNPTILSTLSDGAEYDESLLLWHIATELCFFTSTAEESQDSNREFCKVLSYYMLYLLVMRPTLMSAVSGIAKIRFQDTCEEARKFFKRWQSESTDPSEADREACKRLLDVKTVAKLKPNDVKGDRSKSLLFDACILAKELKNLGNHRWEMMSRVWVELLCYAGSHCRPDVHARQLSQGGELIAFVWLQMVHFGLGDMFRIEAGHARAKLLVSK